MHELREFIQDSLAKARVPGFAIAIVKGGTVVFADGFGQRDCEADLPVTADTLFAIGSCTKAFTTLALGILVERGRIAWEQPVREILPDFRLYDAFAGERLTVRDMVTHRSGLPRHDLVWYGASFTRDELVRRLRYLVPSRDLRQAWQYQNLMYAAAGHLVGVVAGCSWEEFIQRELFEPLGMPRSNCSVVDSQADDNIAQPYYDDAGELRRIPFRNLDAVGPAGSINSSVNEMTRWMQFQLGDGTLGSRRIVSEPTLREMHRPCMPMPDPLTYDEIGYLSYTLGWWTSTYRGRRFVQHSGGIDGFTALTTLLPDEQLGVVTLSNRGGNPLTRAATYRAIDLLLEQEPINWLERLIAEQDAVLQAAKQGRAAARKLWIGGTQPSHALNEYAGSYEHPGYGTLRVTHADDGLHMQINGFEAALEHVHYDVFYGFEQRTDTRVRIAFDTALSGLVSGARAELEQGIEPIVFVRQPETVALSRDELARFAGTYALGPAEMTITLRDDDVLVLAMPGQVASALQPEAANRFRSPDTPGLFVTFHLDEHGDVSEALVMLGAETAAIPKVGPHA